MRQGVEGQPAKDAVLFLVEVDFLLGPAAIALGIIAAEWPLHGVTASMTIGTVPTGPNGYTLPSHVTDDTVPWPSEFPPA
jgi:hypothetical protein